MLIQFTADSLHVAHTAITLEWQPIGHQGINETVTGTVTVVVTNETGDAVTSSTPTASGSAWTTTVSKTTPGRLTAVWSVDAAETATTRHEVVGAAPLTRAAHNEAHRTGKGLGNDEWWKAVHEVDDFFFHDAGGYSTVPRWCEERTNVVHDGDRAERRLHLHYPHIRSVSAVDRILDDGTLQAVTIDDVRIEHRHLYLPRNWPAGRLRVRYTHGLDRPTPRDEANYSVMVRYAAATPNSMMDLRARSYETPSGLIQLTTEGAGQFATAIPSVNRYIMDRAYIVWGVA